MNRCPQCNRIENDNALAFCRVDGAPLITGPLADSENTTAIFDSTAPSSESTTRNFSPQTNEGVSRTTGPTTALPSQHLPSQTRPLTKPARAKLLLVVGGAIVVALGIGRDVAVAYAGLDQKDLVFGWLEKSFQQRSQFMGLLRLETLLDPVKSDPRWNELLKRVGV